LVKIITDVPITLLAHPSVQILLQRSPSPFGSSLPGRQTMFSDQFMHILGIFPHGIADFLGPL